MCVGWVIAWLGMWGPLVSEVAGWKVLCQHNGLTFAIPLCLCKLSVSGREFSLLLGDADFGHWPQSCIYALFPFLQSTRDPHCLRKGQDAGRKGAGRQVRASMGRYDSVVCWKLVPG